LFTTRYGLEHMNRRYVSFTACGIKHRRYCWLVASSVLYTTSCKHKSSAPEDGSNYRPKHVELIEVINKLSFLHLVGCSYYYFLHKRLTRKEIKYLKSVVYFIYCFGLIFGVFYSCKEKLRRECILRLCSFRKQINVT